MRGIIVIVWTPPPPAALPKVNVLFRPAVADADADLFVLVVDETLSIDEAPTLSRLFESTLMEELRRPTAALGLTLVGSEL